MQPWTFYFPDTIKEALAKTSLLAFNVNPVGAYGEALRALETAMAESGRELRRYSPQDGPFEPDAALAYFDYVGEEWGALKAKVASNLADDHAGCLLDISLPGMGLYHIAMIEAPDGLVHAIESDVPPVLVKHDAMVDDEPLVPDPEQGDDEEHRGEAW